MLDLKINETAQGFVINALLVHGGHNGGGHAFENGILHDGFLQMYTS
jgi:hypothetical protein